MINKQIFNDMLDGNMDSVDIQSAIDHYPYCQILHVLDAKRSVNDKSFHANEQAELAAVYAGSREALFNFLFQETLSSTFSKVVENVEQIEKAESQVSIKTDHTSLNDDFNSEEIVDDSEEPVNIEPEHEELYAQLEKEILASAVSSTISKEADDNKVANEDLEEIQIEVSEQPKVFSDWLKTLSGEEPRSKKYAVELINKFIQNDPQITPKKAEFFSPIEQAKLSLAEDETLVTETLANIYASQGQVKKAIKAFKILSDKNPEKKTFFAAQIKKLETQLKK